MGYQEIEHTGDCAIRIWADDLAALFTDAAHGLYQLSGSQMGTGKTIKRRLSLGAADLEGLLVMFLSELIYLQEHSGLGFQEFRLRVQEYRLTGTMHGGALRAVSQPLKAVTYHGLKIARSDAQYSCIVVFDA
ncbi:MAG: archease [Anaerolineales bacterium]